MAHVACSRCGGSYNDRARGELKQYKVCPSCRDKCVTCKRKKPRDSHKQCYSCRSIETICVTCQRPFMGRRRECAACTSVPMNLRARDRRYSLRPGQYSQMLTKQNGVCAISHKPETSVSSRTGRIYPLAVDHDRSCCPGDTSCGKCVRELITRNLNVALGMFGDDPDLLRAAADYIERHRAARNSAQPPG